jgi:hypothetical protein
MTKTLDLIAETIRSSRHPFPHTDSRPHKSQKHRYERRKVKEIIRIGDWVSEAQA